MIFLGQKKKTVQKSCDYKDLTAEKLETKNLDNKFKTKLPQMFRNKKNIRRK